MAASRSLQTTKIWIGSLREHTRASFVKSWLDSEGFRSDVVVDVFIKSCGPDKDAYGFIDVVSTEVACV